MPFKLTCIGGEVNILATKSLWKYYNENSFHFFPVPRIKWKPIHIGAGVCVCVCVCICCEHSFLFHIEPELLIMQMNANELYKGQSLALA